LIIQTFTDQQGRLFICVTEVSFGMIICKFVLFFRVFIIKVLKK